VNLFNRLAFVLFAWGIFWLFNANEKGMRSAIALMILGSATMTLSAIWVQLEAERQVKGEK
jgi:hypothetical protein